MSVVNTAVIKGTFYWPCLGKKNQMKGKYTLDVGQLSDKVLATLKRMGVGNHIKVDEPREGYTSKGDKFVSDDPEQKDRPNRGRYIVLKSNYIPKVEDRSHDTIDPSAVGEGSKGQVRVQAYDWTFLDKESDAKKGTLGAGFNKVVVSELVTFTGGDNDDSDFDYEEEDDFKSEEEEDEVYKYESADDDEVPVS